MCAAHAEALRFAVMGRGNDVGCAEALMGECRVCGVPMMGGGVLVWCDAVREWAAGRQHCVAPLVALTAMQIVAAHVHRGGVPMHVRLCTA